MKFVPTSSQPKIFVNEQLVKVTKDMSLAGKDGRRGFDNEIFQINDHSVGLVSDEYELNLVYDGKRIMMKAGATNSAKPSVVSVGVTTTGSWSTILWLTETRGCVFRKPEQFIASYALNKEGMPRVEFFWEHSKLPRLDQDCVYEERRIIWGNVISGQGIWTKRYWGIQTGDTINKPKANSALSWGLT